MISINNLVVTIATIEGERLNLNPQQIKNFLDIVFSEICTYSDEEILEFIAVYRYLKRNRIN